MTTYYKKTVGEKIFDVFNYMFMIGLCLVTLYPFWFILAASFSTPIEVIKNTGLYLWPKGFTTVAYEHVFKNRDIWMGYRNTIIYLVLGTSIAITMTTLGAYVLSREKLYGRNVFMGIILFTMFFHGGMIPTFLLIKTLGIYDTIWAMVLPGAISTYNLIIMRTAFKGIPVALEEAAKIDGANDLRILWKIIIPLSIPVMAVIALFEAVQVWNAFFNALLFLADRNKYPLQVILREILLQNSSSGIGGGTDVAGLRETMKYATIMVSTVPILCIYPFVQKYFMKGVMIGGVKG